MTLGVGGSTAEKELALLTSSRDLAEAIGVEEYHERLKRARALMLEHDIDALYLDATTSLRYFTGMNCYASERLHGAIVFRSEELFYVCPAFEEQKTLDGMVVEGGFVLWQEHESPTEAVLKRLSATIGKKKITLAIDHQTPFFTASRLQSESESVTVINAEKLIAECRRIKSSHEITLLKQAKQITLRVHQAVAKILHPGIDTREVQRFLDLAHIACGMDGASTFKIVLFGEPTAYPHGVSYPQTLVEGDMVLIDTGATLYGYNSDITRSYVFGEPTSRQSEIWELEKKAQQAAFAAAKIGAPCSAPDTAARKVIEEAGMGPDYAVPGLPHRTGHGVGLDVHEHPYIVKGNEVPLSPGMCFSIEPMICSYGEFGVRLEDHAYIADDGARWFTEPSESIGNPLNH